MIARGSLPPGRYGYGVPSIAGKQCGCLNPFVASFGPGKIWPKMAPLFSCTTVASWLWTWFTTLAGMLHAASRPSSPSSAKADTEQMNPSARTSSVLPIGDPFLGRNRSEVVVSGVLSGPSDLPTRYGPPPRLWGVRWPSESARVSITFDREESGRDRKSMAQCPILKSISVLIIGALRPENWGDGSLIRRRAYSFRKRATRVGAECTHKRSGQRNGEEHARLWRQPDPCHP